MTQILKHRDRASVAINYVMPAKKSPLAEHYPARTTSMVWMWSLTGGFLLMS